MIDANDFFNPSGYRDPREHVPAYMAWIAGLPCCACAVAGKMVRGVHVAHLRGGSLEHEKRATGMQEKPADWWTTPLCPDHHVNGNASQHHVGEDKFFYDLGLNPFDLCVALREAYEAGRPGWPVIAKFAGAAAALLRSDHA